MSGWSAAKALTLFSPSHLDPQSEHCFEVSIQSTSQVSAAAVSSHSPVCGMCSGERRGFGSSRVGRGRGGAGELSQGRPELATRSSELGQPLGAVLN